MLGSLYKTGHESVVRCLLPENGELYLPKTITRRIYGNAQKVKEEAACASFGNQVNPQSYTAELYAYASLLKACTKRKDLQTGSKLHADIVARGLFDKDVVIGGTLINMYAKCGDLVKAQEVFDDLPEQNVVSWTSLIAGYAQHGRGEEALYYFECMKHDGFSPDAITFACILKACASTGEIDKGYEIHSQILRDGLLHEDLFIGTALVDMYVKHGLMLKAQEVFDELPLRNIVSWNVLLTGYAQHGCVEEALTCFKQMQDEGLVPDAISLVGIMKALGSAGVLAKGQELHAQVVKLGFLEEDDAVGNALVDMYAKCGAIERAREVFDELPFRNVISWTALIAGYAQHGYGEEALKGFEDMQSEGLSPDQVAFACILKVCGSMGVADKGQEIHAQLFREGPLKQDIIVCTALVEMYAKCGMFGNAQEAFREVRIPNVVLWNALVGGYVQHGHGEEALKCFERLLCEGLFPDAATFSCIFRACGNLGDVWRGQGLHAQVSSRMLKDNLVNATALVDMYAKCNLLEKAQTVFDHHKSPNLGMWNALIVGYTQYGHHEAAIACFRQMQQECFFPDTVTFASLFKACGTEGAADEGRKFHALIVGEGLVVKDTAIANALIDMYIKCDALLKSQEVFDKLLVRNIASWNALIAGYAQHGYNAETLDGLNRMHCEGILADPVTLASVFKACGSLRAANKGKEIHAQISLDRLLERDTVVFTALLDMYAKCGLLGAAQKVFDRLPVRDVVSWNAFLAGCVQQECGEEVLKFYEQMQHEGVSADAVTFLCTLKACGSIGDAVKGQELHAEIKQTSFLITDILVGNALMDMYAKCGLLGRAQEVFEELPFRTLVSWNVLMSGYAQNTLSIEVFKCFICMQLDGYSPDRITFLSLLKACGGMRAAADGQAVQSAIARVGLLEKDLAIGTALVDMYAKCAMLAEAQEVFDNLINPDVVSWNALVVGYLDHVLDEEALKCIDRMHSRGFCPDGITFVCGFKACGNLGSANKGQELHAAAVREGYLENDAVVGNAVVEMYATCGMVSEAQDVFNELLCLDVVSWNAMISGYAQFGKDGLVFSLFDRMIEEDQGPDLVTCTLVLNVCSHKGLLKDGLIFFEMMGTCHGVTPDADHYTCLVDLFGRAGQLDKAVIVLEGMPFLVSPAMWHTLLGACQKWGDTEIGKWAFEHALQTDELDVSAYICMSNIYAATDRQDVVNDIADFSLGKKILRKRNGHHLYNETSYSDFSPCHLLLCKN